MCLGELPDGALGERLGRRIRHMRAAAECLFHRDGVPVCEMARHQMSDKRGIRPQLRTCVREGILGVQHGVHGARRDDPPYSSRFGLADNVHGAFNSRLRWPK